MSATQYQPIHDIWQNTEFRICTAKAEPDSITPGWAGCLFLWFSCCWLEFVCRQQRICSWSLITPSCQECHLPLPEQVPAPSSLRAAQGCTKRWLCPSSASRGTRTISGHICTCCLFEQSLTSAQSSLHIRASPQLRCASFRTRQPQITSLLPAAGDRAALCMLQYNPLIPSFETQRKSHLVCSTKAAHHLPPLQSYQEIRRRKKKALTKISHSLGTDPTACRNNFFCLQNINQIIIW